MAREIKIGNYLIQVKSDLLRDYYKYYKPAHWLFPGQDESKPITTRTVERVFENSKAKAEITKPGNAHILRHSFATHLLYVTSN